MKDTKNHPAFRVVLLLVWMITSGCAGPEMESPDPNHLTWVPYFKKESGFSIKLPKGWMTDTKNSFSKVLGKELLFFAVDGNPESNREGRIAIIGIHPLSIPENVSPIEFQQTFINERKSHFSIQTSEVTLPSGPALFFQFKAPLATRPLGIESLTVFNYLIIHNNLAYNIILASDSAREKLYRFLFDQIIQTFQIYNIDEKTLHVALPNRDWAVELDRHIFQVSGGELSSSIDGRSINGSHIPTNIHFSIFLEKRSGLTSAIECRAYYWELMKKSSLQRENVKMTDAGETVFVEYLVKNFMGKEVSQKSVHGYLRKGDVCIDIHLSKSPFANEKDIFKRVFEDIKITDYKPTSLDYLAWGNQFYSRSEYSRAIDHYQRALNIDGTEPRLDPPFFRMLIDHLGISYALSMELEKAKETFELGISKDPYYPLFHYNLAATYAEMNNIENAIVHLKEAYEKRTFLGHGELLPDPRKDNSFRPFLKNEQFLKTLKQYH